MKCDSSVDIIRNRTAVVTTVQLWSLNSEVRLFSISIIKFQKLPFHYQLINLYNIQNDFIVNEFVCELTIIVDQSNMVW